MIPIIGSVGAGTAALAPAAAAKGAGSMSPALTSGLLAGGAGAATGIAQALLTPEPKEPKDYKVAMPGANVGQLSAKTTQGPIFGGRQNLDLGNRQSLSKDLLAGGYK